MAGGRRRRWAYAKKDLGENTEKQEVVECYTDGSFQRLRRGRTHDRNVRRCTEGGPRCENAR
eukprot:11215654-Lingulodinium_polyedra.AAC.1